MTETELNRSLSWRSEDDKHVQRTAVDEIKAQLTNAIQLLAHEPDDRLWVLSVPSILLYYLLERFQTRPKWLEVGFGVSSSFIHVREDLLRAKREWLHNPMQAIAHPHGRNLAVGRWCLPTLPYSQEEQTQQTENIRNDRVDSIRLGRRKTTPIRVGRGGCAVGRESRLARLLVPNIIESRDCERISDKLCGWRKHSPCLTTELYY